MSWFSFLWPSAQWEKTSDGNELQAVSLLPLTACSLNYNKLIELRAVKGL